jgi:hypothetical protein
MEIVTNLLSSPPRGTNEDPDLDFYQERWLRSLTYVLLFGIVFDTTFILFVPTYGTYSKAALLEYLVPTAYFINWLPVSSVLGIASNILLSLFLNEMFPLRLKALLRILNVYFLFVYVTGPLWNVSIIIVGFGTSFLLYVGLSIYCIRDAKVTK